VVFYGSHNLKEWIETGRFKTGGFLGHQYECPGLAQVPIEAGPDGCKKLWVLFISINPGLPIGESAVQYFIGDWDGKTFTSRGAAARVTEFSKDWYAFQSWEGSPDGNPYGIAWDSNWQYSQTVPTSTFRSRACLVSSPSPTTDPTLCTAAGSSSTALLVSLVLLTRPSTRSPTTKQLTRQTVDLEGDGGFNTEASFFDLATANIIWNSIGS